MLRIKDEEISHSGSRGRSLSRKWAELHTEEEDEDEDGFSESELELYEQYRAAGYRDLVSVCDCVSDPSAVRAGTSCGVMRLPAAGVAERGGGCSAGLSEEEGCEGEAREKTREEAGEEGEYEF